MTTVATPTPRSPRLALWSMIILAVVVLQIALLYWLSSRQQRFVPVLDQPTAPMVVAAVSPAQAPPVSSQPAITSPQIKNLSLPVPTVPTVTAMALPLQAPARGPQLAIDLVPLDLTGQLAATVEPDLKVTVNRSAQLLFTLDPSRYYPRRYIARGTSGSSRLQLQLSASGRVTAVTILHSEPAGVFDAAALRLGKDLRYDPALRDGQAVASTVEIILKWQPQ